MLSVRVYTRLILCLQSDAGVQLRPKSRTLARDRICAPRTDFTTLKKIILILLSVRAVLA